VTRLRARLTSEEDDTAWVNVVKRTRDTLHVTALPTIAMREYGAILNRRIAYYLELWEAPFQMWLDDAMEFRVRFPDKELSAGRLSGGQKIVASTSFRFAMSDTFARQVSLLVLDEPSERLDQDNLLILYRVLTHLKEASKHAGRQIILVTHDEGLQGFLDHTVNV
jgi:ATPase subunit of ABC transporter with duplicated ATPase domains